MLRGGCGVVPGSWGLPSGAGTRTMLGRGLDGASTGGELRSQGHWGGGSTVSWDILS